MADSQLAECVTCGKGFKPRSGKSGLYCGMPCYRAAQRAGAYKRAERSIRCHKCDRCGAQVVRTKGKRRDGTRSDGIFCGRECYDAHRAEAVAARDRACRKCGHAFRPHTATTMYCSHACRVNAKRPDPVECVNCRCTFTALKWFPNRGRFATISYAKTCSKDCETAWQSNNEDRKQKIGAAFKGDKHPNWQGGKALLNSTSHRGPNWQSQRKKALMRNGYKCVDCDMTDEESKERFGRSLDVDHVVPFHNFGNSKKANRLSNLECRCASCHRLAEAKRVSVQMVLPFAAAERKARHAAREPGAFEKAGL